MRVVRAARRALLVLEVLWIQQRWTVAAGAPGAGHPGRSTLPALERPPVRRHAGWRAHADVPAAIR